MSGADRPGLLAALSRVFSDEGLNIRSAHVASYGERAVDSFYVVDRKGRKITSEQRVAELRAAVDAAAATAVSAPMSTCCSRWSSSSRRSARCSSPIPGELSVPTMAA